MGVVIPFFQREPGLLSSALASICGQSILGLPECTIRVAIVDDSSPVPLADEISAFKPPLGMELLTKRQPNGGAGAARNTALSLLGEDCDVIAFLDSDDTWGSDHLARALMALDSGADFYFCDAQRGEDGISENAALPTWFGNALQPIASGVGIHLYTGPSDLAIVKGMVPTSSVIVHRRLAGNSARFPSRYFRFGEDQYYCLQYLASGSRIAYSSGIEVTCGRGVNIFAGNAPGSESARLCLMDEIAYRKDALATLNLSPEAKSHVCRKLTEARQAAVQQGIWFSLDGRQDWLFRSLHRHPGLLADFPKAAWTVFRTALMKRAPPARQAPPAGD